MGEVKAAEAKLEKLVSSYLDGDIPKRIYLKRKDETMRAIATLKEKQTALSQPGNNWVEPLREWILDTKQAAFLSEASDLHEIRSFVQKIGTNHTVRDKTAHLTVPPLHTLVTAWQPRLSRAAATPSRSSALSEREVSLCALERDRGRTLIGEDDISPHEKLFSLLDQSLLEATIGE